MAPLVQSRSAAAGFLVPSHEACRYNVSSCPPKKRLRQHSSVLEDVTNVLPTCMLPAKKRIVAPQNFEQEMGMAPQVVERVPEAQAQAASSNSCGFCQVPGDSECAGPLMYHDNGSLVPHQRHQQESGSNVHLRCAEWAPNVYFVDDESRVENLQSELRRAHKLKCSQCGVKGAALGCFFKRCRRSFHYACAQAEPGCRWDPARFLLLCPHHASSCRFPGEGKLVSRFKC